MSEPQEGALPYAFTVHKNGNKVLFAKGNLQYSSEGTHIADDGNELPGTWRFASEQYEVLGQDTIHNSKGEVEYVTVENDGWRDMFRWASSGYKGVGPDYKSSEYSDYGDGKNTISKSWWDWGWYNPITNGGDVTRTWRLLTKSEWDYIYSGRPDADKLRAQGTVCGVKGYIFIPDYWIAAEARPFKPDSEDESCDWTHNVYDSNGWAKMEAAGALFFPISMTRYYSDDSKMEYGGYWNGSADTYYAGYWTFSRCNSLSDYYTRYYTANVRLVVDLLEESAVENTTVQAPDCQKIIRDGQILIIRGDRTYNLLGAEVR